MVELIRPATALCCQASIVVVLQVRHRVQDKLSPTTLANGKRHLDGDGRQFRPGQLVPPEAAADGSKLGAWAREGAEVWGSAGAARAGVGGRR